MSVNLIPKEIIENKIFVIRDQKVMLDSDLAKLYGVETKRINEAVKRNIDRFPEDFMFQLNDDEWDILRSQFATLNKPLRKYKPYVFTEQGVAMLSSVLNSKQAIAVNVQIMRVFVKLREIAFNNRDFPQRLSEVEKLLMLYIEKNDERVNEIIQVLNNLLENPKNSNKIGFRTEE